MIATPSRTATAWIEAPSQERRHQPRPRWVGSSRSRNASPTRLKESAVARMISAGDEHEPRRGLEVALALVDDVAP